MPRKTFWAALVLSAMLIAVLVGPASAAIGIYKWQASMDTENITATVKYYLNVNAASGTIDIKNSSGTVVKTISLDAGKLVKGTLHSVIWDGSTDSGVSAPTGTYTAAINVHADAVTGTAPVELWKVAPTAGGFKGIAMDTNPANATYGRVYIGRTATGDKSIAFYEPDGTYISKIPTGFTGGSSVWGVAVGWNGQVYASDRSGSGVVGNFDPVLFTAKKLTSGIGNVQGAHPAVAVKNNGGVYQDSGYYWGTGSTTTGANANFRHAPVDASYNWGTASYVQPFFTDRAVAGCTFGWREAGVGESTIYLAWWKTSNAPPGNTIEKWTSSDGGTTWTVDSTWGGTANSVRPNGVCAYPDTTKLVGFFEASKQIQFYNISDGSLDGTTWGLPSGWTGGSLNEMNFDDKGNAGLVTSSSNISGVGANAGMVAFPDSGSSDSREIATALYHVQEKFKPVLQAGWSFSTDPIPGDNSTTTTFTGTVLDLDGASFPESITGTINCFGTNYTLTLTPVSGDATRWTATATGIKAPLNYKCGLVVCPVTLNDSYGKSNAGVLDPPQYATITVSGGTISGTVKLQLDADETAAVTRSLFVRVKDVNVSNGSKDYTIATNADGTFSASVHAGTFTVSADADAGVPETIGYKQGTVINNVHITRGSETSAIEPTVAPLTINEAKACQDGTVLAIKGIACTNRDDPDSGIDGFTNMIFLRDQSGPGGTYDGIRVDLASTDQIWAVEGNTVVLEATITQGQAGTSVRRINTISSGNIINDPFTSDYGAPTPTDCTSVANDPQAGVDATWGQLFILSSVKVVSVDETTNRVVVADSDGKEASLDIFGSTGLPTAAELTAFLPVGKRISVTGVKDRLGPWMLNCLRPRKLADIVFLPDTKTYTSPTDFVKGGKWNLVSVPCVPSDGNVPDSNPVKKYNDPLVVFTGIDVANASFQFWKNNADGGGYQSYGELFGWTGPIERAVPYWFLEATETTNKTVNCEGFAYPESETDYTFSIALHSASPYWIMIGTPYDSSILASGVQFKNVTKRGDTWLTWGEAFSETDPSQRIIDSNAQGWDAAANRFISVTPPPWMGESAQFEPWWGYWMLVYDKNPLQIKFPKP